ncbi:glycosyl hydrolase [Sphingomonas sp. DG1-23]|uniref:glycosyl hydrolase n=1 Tax=Sphingomonas sp. DG1-23 TaxID=3068316 RepID=UPI00273FF211|nr:glycosyl hydrolase [Sphingomonas sp. DG1-23]MDP5279817.1 glycosyl hydrolase [Sphingomonas sp. DG1-23]
MTAIEETGMLLSTMRGARLREGVALAALALASPAGAQEAPLSEEGFRNPPAEARPNTLYFWMNGNVSHEGIEADLQSIRDAGLGGVMAFDGSNDIPQGPIHYLGRKWLDRMEHMIRRGAELGLSIGMHNAPGWSSSGGPWIAPEQAMQQIVWTETTTDGGRRVRLQLPMPYIKLGYYRDAAVVAFPASEGDESYFRDRVAAVRVGETPVEGMFDRDLHSAVEIGPGAPLVIAMKAPFAAQAVTLYADKHVPAFDAMVEASIDGTLWYPIGKVTVAVERGIEAPGSLNFPAVTANYFRVRPAKTVKLAEALFYATPRIEDWDIKAEHTYRRGTPVRIPVTGTPVDHAIDPAKVIDLTAKVDAAGNLDWNAPKGRWTILRLGHTPTGKINVAASQSGSGLEVDKLSAAALDHQFASSTAKVVAAAGKHAGKAFGAIEVDSYEAGMQNWSAGLPEAFRTRKGYALLPYLPALAGRVVGSADISDRFLFDFRRTLAELMSDNYYGRLRRHVNAAGMRLLVEGYGPGPLDELEVSGKADVPMTEFWTRTPWTDNRVVKMVASAAHIYGKKVVAAEAFTGEAETSRWMDYPYAMKALGDQMFVQGFNQIYFHRYAHQPNIHAVPGMTMGPWGINLDRTNTWFAQSRPWMEYLARSQHLLRQGNYAADILFFVTEESPNEAEYVRPDASPDSSPLLAKYMNPAIPAGYNFDHVNAEVLLTRAKVEDGRIVLPNGAAYRLLVLPDTLDSMTPALAMRLREMVEQGLVLLGPKPRHSMTLVGGVKAEVGFRDAVDAIWGDAAAPRKVGRGRVYASGTIQRVLDDIGLAPDARCTTASPDGQVRWLHRKLDEGDLYFVANRQRRPEQATCSFRVSGKAPELWDPETGTVRKVAVYADTDGRTTLPIDLSHVGSTFVLFRNAAARPPLAWAARDGARFADTAAAAPARMVAPSDSFTISAWAKPDTNLRVMPREAVKGRIDETGKSWLIPARSGRDMHGPDTAVAGLAVGRNGAFVIERVSPEQVAAVLVANMPVSGWTHFALVYDKGVPSLFIDGKLVRTGQRSGRRVFAGGGDPPSDLGVTYFFEGNETARETVARALSASEIAALAAKGPPAPALAVPPAELSVTGSGLAARIWQSGRYALSDGTAFTAEIAAPRTVTGPWQIDFQKDRGAPASITLPKLESLSRNADPRVRYFSGTAIYRRTIEVPAAALRDGRRVYLDLGRVEVLSSVKVNGTPLGVAWKEPYRVDITDVARPGANHVELAVTSLWPNRLIGDARLPDPDKYVPGEWPVGDTVAADGSRKPRFAGKLAALPAWYREGKPMPKGERVTFATWKFFDADEPLLDSGLLGPVRLVFAEDRAFGK